MPAGINTSSELTRKTFQGQTHNTKVKGQGYLDDMLHNIMWQRVMLMYNFRMAGFNTSWEFTIVLVWRSHLRSKVMDA